MAKITGINKKKCQKWHNRKWIDNGISIQFKVDNTSAITHCMFGLNLWIISRVVSNSVFLDINRISWQTQKISLLLSYFLHFISILFNCVRCRPCWESWRYMASFQVTRRQIWLVCMSLQWDQLAYWPIFGDFFVCSIIALLCGGQKVKVILSRRLSPQAVLAR